MQNKVDEDWLSKCRSFNQLERKQWLDGIADIYERMRDRASKGPYEVQCHIPLVVFPNVYAPNFFTDSFWFSQRLPKIVGRASVLEIGTGTGIIAIMLARNGATVVATDVNRAAVENAQENVRWHRLEASIFAREGSVYEAVESGETFDYIFWAHPFNNWHVPVSDMLLRSGFDHNYCGLREYVTGARRHLARNGKLLLGTGDSADLATISAIAIENGYELALLESAEMLLEVGNEMSIRYLICEFVAPR